MPHGASRSYAAKSVNASCIVSRQCGGFARTEGQLSYPSFTNEPARRKAEFTFDSDARRESRIADWCATHHSVAQQLVASRNLGVAGFPKEGHAFSTISSDLSGRLSAWRAPSGALAATGDLSVLSSPGVVDGASKGARQPSLSAPRRRFARPGAPLEKAGSAITVIGTLLRIVAEPQLEGRPLQFPPSDHS